jgi:hypothetical protein
MKLPYTIVAVLGLFSCFSINATTIDFGVSSGKTGSSCAPFGCMGYYGSSQTYQQVYNGSEFGVNTVSIGSISFFHNQNQSEERAQFNIGDYIISLSTTSKEPQGLDSNLLNNIGSDNTEFLSTHLSGPIEVGSIVTFSGDEFIFDPVLGNLLMTITATNLSNQIKSNFDLYQGGNTTSRAFTASPFYDDVIISSEGLKTRFEVVEDINNSTVPQVPESSTLILMLISLLGLLSLNHTKKYVHNI